MSKTTKFKIIRYRPELAHYFKSINEEWITEMFELEPIDKRVIENPGPEILDEGGTILFVEAEGLGIVGTGALMKTGEGEYELTKMGVSKKARGLGAGEAILQALIDEAFALEADLLYLLTNKKCEAAIHLYEKNGFEHDEGIMQKYGEEYQRCNVAMRWRE